MSPEYVYGIHAVTALVHNDPQRAQQLLVQAGRRDARIEAVLALARVAGIPIES